MEEITISELAANPVAVLERVRETKQPILITQDGQPIARITPTTPTGRPDWIGSMEGTVEIVGDIISPASDESDWEVLQS